MDNTDASKKDFIRYMFYLEDDSKSELMNTFQFSLMSLLPIIVVSKIVDKYVPKSDDTKTIVELSAEIVIQTIVLITSVFLTIRLVKYFPTYSGVDYSKINEICVILPLLFTVCMFDDILVEKINCVSNRLVNLWEGNSSDIQPSSKPVNTNGKATDVKTKATNNSNSITVPSSAVTHQMPTIDSSATNQSLSQQLPNYNNMYQQDSNAAATIDDLEPMAANDSFGGGLGSFSNW
jgi:hypothetical protein